MVVLLKFPLSPLCKTYKPMANPLALPQQLRSRTNTIGRVQVRNNNCDGVKAFFLSSTEEPIVREALKEPVAFMGGMFAGLLRLDLNDDPLKEWVTRTVEASAIADEIEDDGLIPEEEAPQQIEIE